MFSFVGKGLFILHLFDGCEVNGWMELLNSGKFNIYKVVINVLVQGRQPFIKVLE